MNKKANYIRQVSLYTCARRAWYSCDQHQNRFVALRPIYTPSYIATQLADIEAAEQLPDFQARSTNTEVLRIGLVQLMRRATNHWQQLKRYISSTYPPNMQHIMYRSAGEHYYRAAALKNWVKLNSLMHSGKLFIAEHQEELSAHNNMPPTFVAEFTAIATEVQNKFEEFIHSRQQSNIDTNTKIAANNQIATQLSTLLADAKVIFKTEPALRRLFTLSHLRHTTQQQHNSDTNNQEN